MSIKPEENRNMQMKLTNNRQYSFFLSRLTFH